MAWPLSQDYNEAIQSPARHFADPDLRGGKAVVNELGLPLPYSGNFADVYQIHSADGTRWAVKCFTREIANLHARYQEISRHLRTAKLPFTVDFSYLEEGIRVGGRWYPVLKMQWVEGLTLNQFVAQYADRPAMLEALLQIWGRLAVYLRTAQVAHGDLQHGNVLLVPGASANSLALKLVDYDGMFVPALAGQQSGEVGHPSYQHPQRGREQTYGPEVDRFPLLLIATTLRALAVAGRPLWEKFDNGDNLLFQETDLQAPTKSVLFWELTKLADPLTAALTDHLLKAVRGGLTAVPLLAEVLPEVRPAPAAARAARPTASVSPLPVVVPSASSVPHAGAAIIARPRMGRGRKWTGKRLAAWMVALMLLVSLGTMVALLRMANNHSGKAPAPVLAQKRPARPDGASGEAPQPIPKGGEKKVSPPRDWKPLPEKDRDLPARKKSPAPLENIGPPPVVRPPAKSITNSIDMKLVWIPAGEFWMGTSEVDLKRILGEKNQGYASNEPKNPSPQNETPQHKVRITRGFYLGVYEVTQAEYTNVMGVNPSKNQIKGMDMSRFPVERVTWRNAVAFCKKLSERPAEKKAGRRYRLPTEAEWEYACRAGTTTLFHYGDTLSSQQANIDGTLPFGNVMKGAKSKGPVKVGSYAPNDWGLYDMHGNVYEWCLDGQRRYTRNAVDNPRGPESDGDAHMLRGGGWGQGRGAVRAGLRKARAAPYQTPDMGFRVLCEVSAADVHAAR